LHVLQIIGTVHAVLSSRPSTAVHPHPRILLG